MLQSGKLFLVERELMRLLLKVVDLSEVRWTKQGHFTMNNGSTLVYSGHETQHTAGVAVWMDKSVASSLLGFNPANERMMSVRIQASPVNVTFILAIPATCASFLEL